MMMHVSPFFFSVDIRLSLRKRRLDRRLMSTDEKKEEDTFTFMKTDESFAVFMKGFNLQHRRVGKIKSPVL